VPAKPEGPERKPCAESDEVRAAVEAFEQILEVLPEDMASLEALSHAYEQLGDTERSADLLLRLGLILEREPDDVKIRDLLPRLLPVCERRADAKKLYDALEAVLAGTRQPGAGQLAAKDAFQVALRFSMPDALAFAWHLLESKELTDSEYAKVVQDLTEMSMLETAATTSVLHVLEQSGYKGLERVLNFVSDECKAPIISLACFEVTPDVTGLLPPDFMVGRGVLPLAVLGKQDLLVVVMNPYEKSLRNDLQALTGRKCHVFLSLPSEFDRLLAKILGVDETAEKKKA